MTRFDAMTFYMDKGRAPIVDVEGGRLESELLYVDFLPEDVFSGLEDFGLRLSARIDKKVFTDVPTGWNSWGGGTGGG